MLDTIPEVEDEEEGEKIEYILLRKTTCSTKATEEERRRSLTQTPPSISQELVHVETLEEEKHKWIEEMEAEGDDVFDISYFDFILVHT